MIDWTFLVDDWEHPIFFSSKRRRFYRDYTTTPSQVKPPRDYVPVKFEDTPFPEGPLTEAEFYGDEEFGEMPMPEMERDQEGPYDEHQYRDQYDWDYGRYTDETLPQQINYF
jgi:hypothetical protein